MNTLTADHLKEAAEDLRWLLNKGYPREKSSDLVGDRFRLNHHQRHLLRRGVFSPSEAKRRKKKSMSIEKIKNNCVGIDGHNVLITLESALKGKPLILADDGLIRDIAGVSNKYRISGATHSTLALIFETLTKYRPRETSFFFDAPISRSGELAEIVRKKLLLCGLSGRAEAVKVPERELLKYNIIATSDSALIDATHNFVDLAGHIIITKGIDPIRLKVKRVKFTQ